MNEKIIEIKKKLETLEIDIIKILGCVETIENSLFFSDQRGDKDIVKPCCTSLEVVINMLNDCWDNLNDSIFRLSIIELDELVKESKAEV